MKNMNAKTFTNTTTKHFNTTNMHKFFNMQSWVLMYRIFQGLTYKKGQAFFIEIYATWAERFMHLTCNQEMRGSTPLGSLCRDSKVGQLRWTENPLMWVRFSLSTI